MTTIPFPCHSRPSRSAIRRILRSCLLLGVSLFLGIAGQVRAGTAVSFDGINDYVTFGPAPALGTPTFAIETWFKRTGTGVSTSTGTGGVTAIPLVTKGRSEADGTTQDMNYFLGIRATDGVLVADFEEGAGGASPGLNHPIAGITPVANNVWYHAAATYDGTKWQLFLNGALDAELTVGRPPRADSIQHAALGSALNSTGAASGFFLGVLDEARVWNYARSQQEISANKDLEITSATGLLGRWGLNEGSGTLATNSTGTTITGTLTNGPLWVGGFQTAGAPTVTRGPYLQSGTPTKMIVRWRTDVATASRVSLGTVAGQLNTLVDDATLTTEHSVQLTGLQPDTQYFYAVGSPTATLASGPDYTFFTSPPVGNAQPLRFWVLGDSGTKDANAAAVRDAYLNFNGTRYTDLCLMLGDNAYENGTDAEYQAAVFNMYPSVLRQTPLWPTIGNHDTAQSTNPALTIPYFQMHTLPTNAEAGGVASGTEKYYSFDYGNVHFICLDSMTSDRSGAGPMATWLQNDLGSTTQDWIVTFFHHPPYTKGSHNSDTETELVQMRSNILPILEAGGVDLVLAGHSHSYERSFLLNGHYGLSSTLTPAMKVDAGSGREPDTGAYQKAGQNVANQGAVYITAGSSGKISGGLLNHPAMYVSLNNLGSLVLDVDAARLDVKFIRENGVVADYFAIQKTITNQPPTVAMSSPADEATFTAPAEIPLLATVGDPDGQVVRVDFYSGNTLIGTATGAPFGGAWSNVPAGSYSLTATATDDRGATTTSAPVTITVSNPSPPAPPGNLTAQAGNQQVVLGWAASPGATSYKVRRSETAGGPYLTIATGLTGLSYTDSALTNGTAYFYVATASGLGGESGVSNEANATPSPLPPAAPTGLAATAGNAQVALIWNASATATGYAVKRATVSDGPYTAIASGLAGTSYTDTTASNGTTYFYVVTASNSGGESGVSNQVSATPLPPPPAAPTGLAATAGNAQVALIWNASATATGYAVKRATVSGGPYTAIGSGLAATSYTDTSVTNGTAYFYVVTASNSGGESGESNQASATPSLPLPAAPTGLVATGVSRTRINLVWTDNATNETGYKIERSTNGTSFSQIATVGAGVTTYASTGLTRNKTYSYRVRAYNAGGNSAYSNTASAKTLR